MWPLKFKIICNAQIIFPLHTEVYTSFSLPRFSFPISSSKFQQHDTIWYSLNSVPTINWVILISTGIEQRKNEYCVSFNKYIVYFVRDKNLLYPLQVSFYIKSFSRYLICVSIMCYRFIKTILSILIVCVDTLVYRYSRRWEVKGFHGVEKKAKDPIEEISGSTPTKCRC